MEEKSNIKKEEMKKEDKKKKKWTWEDSMWYDDEYDYF